MPARWLISLSGALAALGALACVRANPDFDPNARPSRADAAADLSTDLPPADMPQVDLGHLADGTAAADADLAAAPASDSASDSDVTTGAANGTACASATACASGFCVEGVCCNSACGDLCWACSLSHALGTCVPVPDGVDPREQCEAEATSSCGRSGACDGRGGCALHGMGTQCAPQSCAAGQEIAASTCNGAGACQPGIARACNPAACSLDRCAVACSVSAPCAAGFICVGGRCEGSGPALHWRLDEPGGNAALDASGNGHAGNYVGTPAPTPSTNVPTTSFANERSRIFPAGGKAAVRLTELPARLRPSNDITFSVWWRATSVPTAGADIINFGSDLLVRIKPAAIEFAKRKSSVEGQFYDIAAAIDVRGHVNGSWQHLAAVASSTGMRVYLNAKQVASDPSKLPILYRGTGGVLGRDEDTGSHDFVGTIDDFRVYTRDLSGAEIAALARGD